jgi:DNA polymerase III gamma/tau subunit
MGQGYRKAYFGEIRKESVLELYKKHRPTSFQDIVGNQTVVATLRAFLKSRSLPHALLLSGPSGTGKTTIARILKAKLKCSDMDYTEINSADFRGIETIRDLRETMQYAPSGGNVRMFVLDEGHQLSHDAQNALLKLLEDPPEHVYFVICTTTPDKLIKTVRNRCTDLPMKLLTDTQIRDLLISVARKESWEGFVGIEGEEDVPLEKVRFLMMIAEKAQGSARSALVILEQTKGLSEAEAKALVNNYDLEQAEAIDLCRALAHNKSWKECADILSKLETDPETVRRVVLGYMASVLLKASGNVADVASHVISVFEEPFFGGGKPALINACYKIKKG